MTDILDLGFLHGPIMLFGGPYSNLEATQAAKTQAERMGIDPHHCLCTGDVVAYGADPKATVDLVRSWGIHVVQGNCEQALAQNAEHCGCGFELGSTCAALSEQWYPHANNNLDITRRKWMGALPRLIRFQYAEKSVSVIHGGVEHSNQFVFASTNAEEKKRQTNAIRADVIVAGHAGLPFTHTLDNGAIWHNAGAIGLPANDGTPDTWFSLLSETANGLMLTHHRLPYDHQKSASRMRQEGLVEGYAKALECGLWPSLDVLPAAERALGGNPSSLPTLL